MEQLFQHPFSDISFSLRETEDGHFHVIFTDGDGVDTLEKQSISFDSSWVGLKAFVLFGKKWREKALSNETYEQFNLGGQTEKVKWIRAEIEKRCVKDPTEFDLEKVRENQLSFMSKFKTGVVWVNETIKMVVAQKPRDFSEAGMTLVRPSDPDGTEIIYKHNPGNGRHRLILKLEGVEHPKPWFESWQMGKTILHRIFETMIIAKESITRENMDSIMGTIDSIAQKGMTNFDHGQLNDKTLDTRFMLTSVLKIPGENLAQLVIRPRQNDSDDSEPLNISSQPNETAIERQTALPISLSPGRTFVSVDLDNVMGDEETG